MVYEQVITLGPINRWSHIFDTYVTFSQTHIWAGIWHLAQELAPSPTSSPGAASQENIQPGSRQSDRLLAWEPQPDLASC